MKSVIKRGIAAAVNNKLLWIFIKPVAKLGFFAFYSRRVKQVIVNVEGGPYASIFEKKEVLSGPFKGMKYPSLSSVGSSLYPKLLGSYEKELHQVIGELMGNNYTEILDIGCAEGYYAIGLSLKKPRAKVYAYDTDETARALCEKMAHLNGVDDKVILRETCTAKELVHFKFTGHALIVCDCEGYEEHLFTPQNVSNLKDCDLLIETHDFLNLSTSLNLIELFKQTHHIKIIKSIGDIEKAQTYVYPETHNLSLNEKFELHCERRPTIMDWLVCTPI
ncbi:methyltransferase [Mucilaginibacter gilvus]|uniref:Methyltransferase small domain-containing protein n=1 Tax=Mucilaginibacter gilvus TaxID=2305909 RepID=A0A444MPA2_9SPHI|nr:methyltransferase [Mucilaginibacter gilvus]RWY52482.1 hypothetical protein EPL05_11290 [Mucilaginibacter gilvus]